MMHAPGHHWNSYHQAFIGNRPVHLAHAGYRPSFYNHHWHHGPWGGHAWGWGWGWGWGYGPGVSFALTSGGFGASVGSGWGYPTYYGRYGRYDY